jgi:predicted DNA-binding protein
MKSAAIRSETYNIRLSDEERVWLNELAEHYHAPAATVIRMLIKQKHDSLRAEGKKLK